MITMESRKYPMILEAAHRAWLRLEPARERRRRFARYTYGDQWGDPVMHRGRRMTEGEAVAESGRPPLSNNLIRRLVKSVVGRYRQDRSASATAANAAPAMEATRRMNRLDELDARTLEEFLISGMAIHRVCAEHRPAGAGVWVDNVAPDRFFVSAVSDPRCTDMELAGRLLDMSVAEAVMRFAPGDDRRARDLRALYGTLPETTDLPATLDPGDAPDFYRAPAGRCRVIEVWTLECREVLCVHDRMTATLTEADPADEPRFRRFAARRRRKGLPPVELTRRRHAGWHGRFLAPDGTLLGEAAPVPGGGCPFAVKLYPLTDGEVHSLVEDVIDQQKYVNRLISMMDTMLGVSAKGVLLYPVQCKPDNMRWDDVARLWAEPGGIIPYRPTPAGEPHQVIAPISDIGARDLLQTQIKLFEEVSGVSDALMGRTVSGAIGVDRYEREVRNAAASIADLIETYADFIGVRDGIIRAVSKTCGTEV